MKCHEYHCCSRQPPQQTPSRTASASAAYRQRTVPTASAARRNAARASRTTNVERDRRAGWCAAPCPACSRVDGGAAADPQLVDWKAHLMENLGGNANDLVQGLDRPPRLAQLGRRVAPVVHFIGTVAARPHLAARAAGREEIALRQQFRAQRIRRQRPDRRA